MNKTQRKKLYKKAWEKWGFELQMVKFVEELSELQKAICKYHSFWKKSAQPARDIVEEIADVEIMIEQLETQHNWENWRSRIETAKSDKLKRLKERVKDE